MEWRFDLRPIIGICMNYSSDDTIGTKNHLGLAGQTWQLIATDYITAVEKNGGCPVLIPIVDHLESIESLLLGLDGIIFTGGNDISPSYYNEEPGDKLGLMEPIRDRQEITLFKKIFSETSIPILGICRGMQLINVAMGGSLYQHINDEVTEVNHSILDKQKDHRAHKNFIEKDSVFFDIFNTEIIEVNSFHHQSAKRVADDLKVAMTSEDGIIEALQYKGKRFLIGTQWHPEMMTGTEDTYNMIFKRFIAESEK